MSLLTVIVPTRGRPQNVSPIVDAWWETGAFADGAALLFVIDADDVSAAKYQERIHSEPMYGRGVDYVMAEKWEPMVPKLNRVAVSLAAVSPTHVSFGFMGDDHLPRTVGWVKAYLRALDDAPSIVSCPDGARGDDLPTHWAMTADIIRALGRMVPAPVEHLYCDNSVRDLAYGASRYRWLPDVLVEHMHPITGKAEMDAGYKKVNSGEQYRRDRSAYAVWAFRDMRGDIATLQGLREETSDGQ